MGGSAERRGARAESANSDLEMDDEDWMEQELRRAKQNLHLQEKQRSPQAALSPTTGGLKLTHEGTEAADGAPTVFVANLPYNVAATIILDFFERMPALARAVVMVQKEVADRIAARPGTKAYGAYTAKLALFAEVTGRFEVPPRCFLPAPHVDSAVVRLDRWGTGAGPLAQMVAADDAPAALTAGDGSAGPSGAAEAPDADQVCRVIDATFAQRRKTIRNSMAASGFDKAALDSAYAAAGIAPTARAETLAPADFVRLTCALKGAGAL